MIYETQTIIKTDQRRDNSKPWGENPTMVGEFLPTVSPQNPEITTQQSSPESTIVLNPQELLNLANELINNPNTTIKKLVNWLEDAVYHIQNNNDQDGKLLIFGEKINKIYQQKIKSREQLDNDQIDSLGIPNSELVPLLQANIDEIGEIENNGQELTLNYTDGGGEEKKISFNSTQAIVALIILEIFLNKGRSLKTEVRKITNRFITPALADKFGMNYESIVDEVGGWSEILLSQTSDTINDFFNNRSPRDYYRILKGMDAEERSNFFSGQYFRAGKFGEGSELLRLEKWNLERVKQQLKYLPDYEKKDLGFEG